LVIAIAAALVAQISGAMVAFLGIFGWGLFASTLVPALAIGLNWQGATRAGAICSIAAGLTFTLSLEIASFFKVFTFPSGVTASAVSLVVSMLVFLLVSRFTRSDAEHHIDEDVRIIMEM